MPFDPYYNWLGIPPDEQPPNHYRLLGLRLFEPDAKVIATATDRQMAHVKTFQNGPNAADSQRLLNELAKAQVCLLRPDLRAAYDQTLRAPTPAPPPVVRAQPQVESFDAPLAFDPPTITRRKKKQDSTMFVLLCTALVASVLIIAFALNSGTPAPTSDPLPLKISEPTIVEIIKQIEPSVVRIETNTGTLGSGVVIGNEGLILTNYHVLEGAYSASAVFHDGKRFSLLGFSAVDKDRDLILMKTRRLDRPLAVALATALPEKGQQVIAFGNPAGLNSSSSTGIVSGVRSSQEAGHKGGGTWIQHTAPISKGNSGGPLVNLAGELLGINTWTREGAQNLNFAISAPDIQKLIENIAPTAALSTLFPPKPVPSKSASKAQPAPAPPPETTVPAKPVPTPQSAPEKVVELSDPFPSGKVFSPAMFDVNTSDLDRVLNEKNSDIVVVKHNNGRLFGATSVVQSRPRGPAIARHDNDQPSLFMTYDNEGRKVGILKAWDYLGRPVIFAEHLADRPNGFAAYFDQGDFRALVEYRRGELQWVRIVSQNVVVDDLSADNAKTDDDAAPVLTRFNAAWAVLRNREADFEKRVKDVDRQQRDARAKARNVANLQAAMEEEVRRNAAIEAANRAAAQEMMRALTTPTKYNSVPIKVDVK